MHLYIYIEICLDMFRLFQNMSNIHKQQLNSELNFHRPRFEGTFFWYTQPHHGPVLGSPDSIPRWFSPSTGNSRGV